MPNNENSDNMLERTEFDTTTSVSDTDNIRVSYTIGNEEETHEGEISDVSVDYTEGGEIRELDNGATLSVPENIEITEVNEDPDGEDPYTEIQYTGDLHTVIPIKYYYHTEDSNELQVETHHVPTTTFVQQDGTDGRSFRFRHHNVFNAEDFEPNPREEALDDLSGEAMPEDVEEHIADEIREHIGEEIRELAEEETGTVGEVAAADVVEEDEEMESDDMVIEATADAEEHSHSEDMMATSEEMQEQLRRDMDGRYNYAENREEELRELAADIETRIDHLLRKRQRIKEKLEEELNNE